MPSVKAALAAGLGVTAIAAALTLTQAPASVARSNLVAEEGVVAATAGGVSACQVAEELPRSVSAIRLSLQATIGPRVTVEVLAGEEVLTRGTRGAGWTAGAVTVPVSSPLRAGADTTICFTLGPARGPISAYGGIAPAALRLHDGDGSPFAGRMKVEYLRPGSSSWWSQILSVARRMGLGHAGGGTWLAVLAAALAMTLVALASWLVVKELA
jgi:hypothetical protein